MDGTLHILIVEDSEDDARLLIRALGKGGYDLKVWRVETAAEMQALLGTEALDIVLADYTLPRFSGLAALKLLQEAGIDIPFIIVSGTIGEETAVAAMKAGAHDYVMKNNLSRLIPAIEREMQEAAIRRERRQMLESLRESEARLRYLISSCPAVIFTAKTSGNHEITFVGSNVKTMLGHRDEDFIGDRDFWINHVHPDDRACIHGELANLPSNGYHICEYRMLHKDGSYRWLRGDMLLARDACDRPVEIIGSWIDITKLKEAEENYEGLFQNAPVGIFRSTPAGGFLTANRSMARMLSYDSPAELIMAVTDMRHQLYVNPGDRKKLMELILRTGPVKGFETQLYRKDGSIVWGSLNVRTVFNEKGQVLYNEGILEDITDRKKHLESLKQALEATARAMAIAVETRDPYTAGHQRRVADLACAIACELGLLPEDIEGIRVAGSIHDLGKIAIPSEILSKPTQISEIEYSLLKTHAEKGYEILKDIEFSWPVARMVHEHHERLDGSGYPRGLKGEELLIGSQVISVADVVEAIASFRPYRPPVGMEKALEEIDSQKGVLYNPDVVNVCRKLFLEKGYTFPA